VLALLSTAMTGCRDQATSGTVNSTFVDVNGLLTAPTKVATSYPTEELNMGNDNSAGIPQFLDGVLYTFSYHSDLSQWTTAWDQATGKKLWSVYTNAFAYIRPYTTFTTDGKHLFFVRTDLFKSGEPGVVASIACLDKTTGATLWQSTPTVTSPFVFGVRSNIAVHINEQSHTADHVYVIGEEERTSTSVPTTEEVRHPGIWIWDAATGASLDRIDWTALPIHSETSGQLLCDGWCDIVCRYSRIRVSNITLRSYSFQLRYEQDAMDRTRQWRGHGSYQAGRYAVSLIVQQQARTVDRRVEDAYRIVR